MRPPSRLCDDDRLLRARDGQLTASEWREHSDHLAACADCRMDWLVGRDFDQSAAVRTGDEQLVAAATRAVLVARRTGLTGFSRVAVAAAVLLAAAASASGAIVWRLHSSAARSSVERLHGVKRPAGKVSRAPLAVPAIAVPTPTAPAVEIPVPPFEGPPAATHAPASKAGPHHPLASVSAAPTPSLVIDDGLAPPRANETAHGLLNEAMSERQQGHYQSAIAALRSLRRQFPDSPEGAVGLISLGNLLLDGREPADALPLFERYCTESPSGALLPEAMAGQARSLEQLQRPVEAEAMWQELVRRFPGSLYARSKKTADVQGSRP